IVHYFELQNKKCFSGVALFGVGPIGRRKYLKVAIARSAIFHDLCSRTTTGKFSHHGVCIVNVCVWKPFRSSEGFFRVDGVPANSPIRIPGGDSCYGIHRIGIE
ncbi:hypothetical protein, partial [Alistipes sp.]|uniref:hypothetical protein n=1 Tax=Alistipes sp. TaxID=1872444 RepID=UPI003A8B6FDF